MATDRVHLQRKAAEPAAAGRGTGDARIAGSPALLAQRKQIENAFGAAQLAGPDEELQKKAPEEELQKKGGPEEELK
jgi:hypothetical protein